MPFGFHLAMDTLPSGDCEWMASGPPWPVSGFRFRARLGFSIPSTFSGQRGITPAFGYGAPHPSARGTSTLLSNALLSAHYGELLTPLRVITETDLVAMEALARTTTERVAQEEQLRKSGPLYKTQVRLHPSQPIVQRGIDIARARVEAAAGIRHDAVFKNAGSSCS